MAEWRAILFAEAWYSDTDEGGMQDEEPWRAATAGHLLQLLKLLGVEQQRIANYLQVSKGSLSRWVHQSRPTPGKYRAALLPYAQTALRHALTLKGKEVQALPPFLQDEEAARFAAMLGGWAFEVRHGRRVLTWFLKEQGEEFYALLAHEPWTAEELARLRALCKTIQAQLKELEALEAAYAERDTAQLETPEQEPA